MKPNPKKFYFESRERTHRMRMRDAWGKYAQATGRDASKMPRSFPRRARREDWLGQWEGFHVAESQLLQSIGTTITTKILIDGNTEMKRAEFLATMHAILHDRGDKLAELVALEEDGGLDEEELKEVQKKQSRIIKQTNSLASIIKSIEKDTGYWDRALALMRET